MISKRHLKSHTEFGSSFITENLTPFRSKLLWYVKKKCDGRFVNVHTRDGNIKVQLNDAHGENDDWHTITSPDDLFQHGVDVDLSLINENYFRFQVLPQIDITATYNRFDALLDEIDVDS